MPSKDHLHTLKRVLGSKEEYICMDPDCDYRVLKRYMVNKRALCPICAEPFVIRNPIRLAQPHCDACTKGSNKKQLKKVITKIVVV